MKPRHFLAALLSASFIAGQPAQVAADNALAGGIIGGIIGGAIMNEAAKNQNRQRTTTRRVQRSSVPSAQRVANRETQESLNHFAWNVGTADGVLGRRSRTGISQYQAFMQFPVTGQLTELERTILVTSYQKAMIGGPEVAQTVSTHPQGMRGLLLDTRDQMLGTRMASGGYGRSIGGLPPQISDAVFEIARNSNVEPQQLIARAGFIQLADLNSDGRTDYLIDTSVTGSGFWCNEKSCAVRVFASTPDGYQRNDFQAFNATPAMFSCQHGLCRLDDAAPAGQVMAAQPAAPAPATLPPATEATAPQPQPQSQAPAFSSQLASAPAPAKPAMPSFAAAVAPSAPPVSLASHCSRIGLVTSSNGGFVTEANLIDPEQALGEQFCLARSYAMEEGEAMVARIQGFTSEQIAQQCKDFGTLLAPETRKIGTMPRAEVLQSAAAFAAQTGMSPDQLAGTAKICLSVGYRTDDMPVAMGSALILAALGMDAYGELMGHHLVSGIGTEKRPTLAMDWYQSSATATPVFAPGQPERTGLIRKAAMMVNGHGSAAPAPAPQPTSGQGISFKGIASQAASFLSNGAADGAKE